MEQDFKPITSIMLVLTHACNLRCRYCFVHKDTQTITLQVAMDAVDFLLRNCEDGVTPSINFFGGEPMLCWDSIIVPITQYIRDKLSVPFRLSMTTNGTLLNEERIRFMKKYQIDILFSIDGDIQTQDYNRPYQNGNGSFESLRNLIPVIAQEFHPTFRMTAIPQSCENLYHDILFASSSGYRTFFVVPNVFDEWGKDEWDVLSKEFHRYTEYFIECYERGISPIRFSTFEDSIRQIVQINNAVAKNIFRPRCDARYKCGLGTNRFASIHPNGDIYACQEMTSNESRDSVFWIGNIYSGVDNNRRASLSQKFTKEKVIMKRCKSCKLNPVCNGGCVANNYLTSGDINHPPDIYCKWMQLIQDDAIFAMNALASNKRFIKQWGDDYGQLYRTG